MPTSIREIVEHRRQLLRQTVRDTPEDVVVAMDAGLIRQAMAQTDLDLSTGEGRRAFITGLQLNSRSLVRATERDMPKIERLGRSRPQNVVIARGPVPHRSSCWVRDGYSAYREAFKAFVKKVYGAVDFTGFDEMEVDHLASRGQARMGGKFIRIEAVDKSVNRSHGASVEKKQAGQKGRHRRIKDGMSLLSVLKLYSLKPPTSPNDGARIEEIRRVLKADGWDPQEVSRGLAGLLDLYARSMD